MIILFDQVTRDVKNMFKMWLLVAELKIKIVEIQL